MRFGPRAVAERDAASDGGFMNDEKTPHNTVTVGFDGSEGGQRALRWAAREAQFRGSMLRIVHATHAFSTSELGWLASAGIAPDEARAEAILDAENLLKQAAEDVHAAQTDVQVHTIAVTGEPRSVMLAAAENTDLIVVGSRGRGPIRSLLLGSVGVALVRGSVGPVVVVRREGEVPTDRIVVGTNGSTSSLPALRIAFAEAELRKAPVVVIYCLWNEAMVTGPWLELTADDTLHDEAHALVERLLEEVREDHPEVTVELRIVRGPADRCLIDFAQSADLLVVGRHGSTPLDHFGLGTVAASVVENARCAVLVVPTVQPATD